ncbi:hypothetical protein Xen7305DRAFT_00030880 [Xenococcus sp. PCC 7305]|nr:hypothetical protein Xen7305DRAFT_00030880 [Xenococcus sp. PCC 7305]
MTELLEQAFKEVLPQRVKETAKKNYKIWKAD